MIDLTEIKNPIILFDGECNLCSSSVQFIIKHDPKKTFRFASLQSQFGKSIKTLFHISDTTPETILLLKEGKLFQASIAVLLIARELNSFYRFFYYFHIIPSAVCDSFYLFVAKNRYKWFGKKPECWIPSGEISFLFFLDDEAKK